MSADFRQFVAERLGCELPSQIEPGRLVRFSTSDRRGDDAGWAKLFADGEGGVCGDWRAGSDVHVWQAKRDRPLSDDERRAWLKRIERERHEAEAARQRAEAEAAKRAAGLWDRAEPASPNHPYLVAKGVKPHGLKRYHGPLAINGMRLDNALIVPVRSSASELQSLEFIAPNGDKRFLAGGKKSGGYHCIGKPDGVVCIVEGYATGASVHEATGYAVVVALDAGNMPVVAKMMREKFAQARIVIAGDHDESGTGQRAAEEAAQATGALVAIPGEPGQDWNDVHRHQGAEAVRSGIEGARQPATVVAPSVSFVGTSPGALPAIEASSWHTPEPLPELPPVPAFDFRVLPASLRAFAQDIAERMQCPPEFTAVGVVTMVGAAIGRRVGIRPKQFDSWTVIPNVWGMIVGKPGLMKSPALAEAISPMKRMQAKAFQEFEGQQAEYEIAERAAKIKAADAEKRAREKYAKDKSADLGAMLKPEGELVAPKRVRYVINDSTPEALCETLRDNEYGVLCERDELIGLLRSMDREGNQEARALYLTAADGDKSFTVDRIMRGSARHIKGLCVSIVGGIQPGVLAGYVRETQRGGSGDDGLLQRFGLMVYPDVSAKYRSIDRPPSLEARRAVDALVERLCNLKSQEVNAEDGGDGAVPFLRFEDKAQELFFAWQTDLEERLRSGDDHPAVASHLSKYRKNVPALALINHLADGGIGPVSEEALSRALLFIELLEAHANRVYSYASRPDLAAAKTILAKLRTGKLAIEFNARDVYRNGWSGLTTPEEARAALRMLCDYGHLRECRNTDTGGRDATTYRAHPLTKVKS